MSAWLVSLEGTASGQQLALALALLAAFLHAVFGALQKGRHDPWLTRGAIDFSYGCDGGALCAICCAMARTTYVADISWAPLSFTLATSCCRAGLTPRAAFTVVYPVVRGVGPFFTVIGAYLIFGETFSGLQWLASRVLMAGILGLAVYNMVFMTEGRETLLAAMVIAVFTGFFVALYTTYDAFGIAPTADPFTFLAWFFLIDGLVFPVLATLKYRAMLPPPALGPLMTRGVIGGVGGFCELWLGHAGDTFGQCWRGSSAAGNFACICGADPGGWY